MGKRSFNHLLLKELRLKQNLTQQALAKKARVSRSYIGMVEAGKITPSLPTLEILAKALGVDVPYFFSQNEPSTSKLSDTQEKFPDIETYLQKILSGEIPIQFYGVDRLTPEIEEDIRTVLRVALSHIQLQKEQAKEQAKDRPVKKAEAGAKGVMNNGDYFQERMDESCLPRESILALVP